MSRQTPLLIPPTLDEVKLQAAKIGLPPREAERFYWHYEKTGWCWGRNVKIKSWIAALMGWKMNWEEHRIERNNQERNGTANDVKREINRWRKEK